MTPGSTLPDGISTSDRDALASLGFGPSLKSCLSTGNLVGLEDLEPKSLKRRVSFGKLEIREYERTVGDNVVSSGVPISLGWEYQPEVSLDLAEYEESKTSKKSQNGMQLPSHVRAALLKNAGCSLTDGMQAARESDIERNRRRGSAAKTPKMDQAEFVLEKAKRKARRLLRRSSKEKENKEIDALIQRDRMRSSKRKQLNGHNSCPTLDLMTCDGSESVVMEPTHREMSQHDPSERTWQEESGNSQLLVF